MTTNDSGKLKIGGVEAIKSITLIPASERTPNQYRYLAACLTALAHQPKRWYSYQDWGPGGPIEFLAKRGIEFVAILNSRTKARSWYEGCECSEQHWKEMQRCPHCEGKGSIPLDEDHSA